MIIIPDYIEDKDIPAEEKLRLGKEFTEQAMIGNLELKELPKENKDESWTDDSIGILVGPNNAKNHRLKGAFFMLFKQLHKAYGHKDSPKRPAAWSFYKFVVPEITKKKDREEKNKFAKALIKAAEIQCLKNQEISSTGHSIKHLQGWISEQRYESYM